MSEKKKNTVGSTKYTIGHFIKFIGGISSLTRKTLIRKFGKEERTGSQWMEFLVESTILKEKDTKLLSTEIK